MFYFRFMEVTMFLHTYVSAAVSRYTIEFLPERQCLRSTQVGGERAELAPARDHLRASCHLTFLLQRMRAAWGGATWLTSAELAWCGCQ